MSNISEQPSNWGHTNESVYHIIQTDWPLNLHVIIDHPSTCGCRNVCILVSWMHRNWFGRVGQSVIRNQLSFNRYIYHLWTLTIVCPFKTSFLSFIHKHTYIYICMYTCMCIVLCKHANIYQLLLLLLLCCQFNRCCC